MGESSGSGPYQKLPPGWDCKFDQATGNCYYINYFTKAMQLEDPRIRYKQLQNERCSTESIPMQPMHGSPYHVYPSNNLPAMRAFQASSGINAHPNWQHMSSSPLLSSRGHLEMSPLPFPKLPITQTSRLGNMSRRSTIQETSFSNHIDTDAVVTKIQNMFPTASENHIRLLLRRYYNREAVVISALQVEKHPVTMPGPFVTPPAQRHLFHSNSAFQMTPPSRRLDIGHSTALGHSAFGIGSGTSRTASPLPGGRFGSVISMNSSGGRGAADGVTAGSHVVGGYGGGLSGIGCYPATSSVLYHGSPRFGEQWRSSPKPHSSPKMKLRYMKNIFPKADEMLLLDVLASADNNVQKASQTLISMGYVKRDFVHQKPPSRLGQADETLDIGDMQQQPKPEDTQIIPLRPKEYTQEEKDAMQQSLKQKYAQIAERIIVMALESVNYSEDRATQILQIVQDEEDATRAKNAAAAIHTMHSNGFEGLHELAATLESSELDALCAAIGTGTGGSGAGAIGLDNLITVVVEETPKSSINNNSNNNNNKNNSNSNKNSINDINNIMDANAQKNNAKKISKTTATNNNNINNTSLTTTATISTLSSSSYASSSLSKKPLSIQKRAFPSINVTTPTTATTQVILSNSPICAENDDMEPTMKTLSKSVDRMSRRSKNISQPSLSSPLSLSLQSPLSSSSTSSPFETITIKSMLARFNTHATKRGLVSSANATGTASLLEKLKLSSRPRDKFDTLKHTQQRNTNVDDGVSTYQQQEFQSLLGRIATLGPNTEINKGPDESLLLADYVTWNGANPDISVGQKQPATGSDPNLLSERKINAHGRNTELCKGRKIGLAKGSIYAQLTAVATNAGTKSANIKCN